jgi:hypothetical protein
MPTASYGVSLSVGGVSLQKSVNRTGDHPNSYEVSLPAAEGGNLSTRTNDTDGDITMDDGGHSITTGATIDIFWSGGRRYGVTVGTVSGTTVPISGGTGDVLPSASTLLTVDEQVVINTVIDGDNVHIIGMVIEHPDPNSTGKGHVDMQDVGTATIEAVDLSANVPVVWDIDGGASNVFTGNVIEKTYASNGSSSDAVTLKILSLEDSTP